MHTLYVYYFSLNSVKFISKKQNTSANPRHHEEKTHNTGSYTKAKNNLSKTTSFLFLSMMVAKLEKHTYPPPTLTHTHTRAHAQTHTHTQWEQQQIRKTLTQNENFTLYIFALLFCKYTCRCNNASFWLL